MRRMTSAGVTPSLRQAAIENFRSIDAHSRAAELVWLSISYLATTVAKRRNVLRAKFWWRLLGLEQNFRHG
jgi:hypothetical protein